jgi:hypothetical protein
MTSQEAHPSTSKYNKIKYLNVSSNISQKKKQQANACGYMYKKSPVQSQSRRVELKENQKNEAASASAKTKTRKREPNQTKPDQNFQRPHH